MSVEQRRVLDFIGTSKADGHLILTISDHLPFDGDAARLVILQDKLNDYLAAIESGEIYGLRPSSNGKPVEILICFKHSPDAGGLHFLHSAAKTVHEAGLKLTYETHYE